MSGPEVAIVVHYQAQPGRGDEVAALLARHSAATRSEPGNLDFVALRSSDHPDSFVLYERYSSREAFDAHLASPHYEGIAVARIRPLLNHRTVEF
ncbi:MAG TPA: putative quinol monooxygenase, partial [Streptosporangiaceae bacterium]